MTEMTEIMVTRAGTGGILPDEEMVIRSIEWRFGVGLSDDTPLMLTARLDD